MLRDALSDAHDQGNFSGEGLLNTAGSQRRTGEVER